MATDVMKKVNDSRIGVEGAAYVAPNGLKIVPQPPQRITPVDNAPVSDVAASGSLHYRFDDPTYY